MRKIPWRREPTPEFLPGEFHGQRSLAGCSPWGHRVRHNWTTCSFHFASWCPPARAKGRSRFWPLPIPTNELSTEIQPTPTAFEVSRPTLCPECVFRPCCPYALVLLSHSAGFNTADYVLSNKQIHSGSPLLYISLSSGISSTCSLNESVYLHSTLECFFYLLALNPGWPLESCWEL